MSSTDASRSTPAKAPTTIKRGTRQVGDPYFHQLVVGGTLSLGILLVVGALAILAIMLNEQSNFRDADLDDFTSLGEACLVISSFAYRAVDLELNSLNTVCEEEWEYNVRVVARNETFVSNTITYTACKRSGCNECPDRKLQGENFYAGVDVKRRGEPIDNETFAECWAPVVSRESLSDFYNCGNQSATCYQLEDPTDRLKDEIDSFELGMIGAYAGLGVGVFLLLSAGWFLWRNRQVLRKDRELQESMNKQSSHTEDQA
jgi:hypothetical protein